MFRWRRTKIFLQTVIAWQIFWRDSKLYGPENEPSNSTEINALRLQVALLQGKRLISIPTV